MPVSFIHGLRRAGFRLCLAVASGMPVALHAADVPVLVRGPALAVTGDDVKASVQTLPPAGRDSFLTRPQNLQRQAEDLYIRRALAAQAEKSGLDKDPMVQAMIQQARERILSDAQLNQVVQGAKPADTAVAAQARDIYRSKPERFTTPAQTRARHILIAKAPDARERAEALLKRLKAGESFETLAAAESADLTTASGGGDLGWFSDGAMVPEFQKAVDGLKNPGDLSDVVETNFGFHVVRLEGRRPAGVRPFEDVREALENDVRNTVQQQARTERIKSVMQDVRIDPAVVENFARSNEPRKP